MTRIYDAPTFIERLPGRSAFSGPQIRTKFDALIPQLQANRGKWAEVAEYDSAGGALGLARALRETHGFTREEWEFATRAFTRADGSRGSRLYLRSMRRIDQTLSAVQRSVPASPSFTVCECTHTGRRHPDGVCVASGCDCAELRILTPVSA